MNNEPKELDTLTKKELIEEYNKLSDFCVDIISKYHKIAADYAEQVKEKAKLVIEIKKLKDKGGNFGNV